MYLRAIGMLMICLVWGQCQAAQTITHPSVAGFSPSQAELRLIFSKQKLYWPDGQPIIVYILEPDSDVHRKFCMHQLDILPYVLQRRWDRLVYSGTGERPKIVAEEQEMQRLVAQTPGAIGYISSQSQAQGGANYEN